MDVLTKAIDHSRGVVSAAREHALRLKAGGLLSDALSGGSTSFLGDMRGQQRDREGYSAFHGWLYSTINAIASRAAKQPVAVAKIAGEEADDKEKRARKPRGSKALVLSKMPLNQRRKAAAQELEVLYDHPMIDVLEHPNPFQNRWQFVYSFVCNLLLTGRSYIVADTVKGRLQFYSLPTTWVRPNKDFTEFVVADPNSTAAIDPKAKPLTRDQVAWAYLPDPANPLGAMSPTRSQMSALRIERQIQESQEQFFGNGIFPVALVTIGKNAHPDVPQSQWVRPRLTNAQRRQVESVIARAMQGSWNYGKPAIIDGMVEDIKPLSMGSQEMGWDRSEDKIKARILSPYGMHSFILGESMPGSYSQAYVVKELHYEVVNTYLDMLSSIVSGLTEHGGGEKLMVWWEECVAVDPSMRDGLLRFLRQNNDMSQNEIRAEAGLPPDEDKNEQVINPSQGAQIVQALGLSAQGVMDNEQLKALMEGMGLPTDLAKRIAGPKKPPPAPPAPEGAVPPTAEEEQPPEFPPGEEGELSKAQWELRRAIREMRKPPELIVGEVMGPLLELSET